MEASTDTNNTGAAQLIWPLGGLGKMCAARMREEER